MNDARIPNVELIDYMAKTYVMQDKERFNRIKNYYENAFSRKDLKHFPINFNIEMWKQTFGSTLLMFDVDENNTPLMGGQMMTDAYVVVCYEPITETYYVFCNSRLCYRINNPTDKFLEDMKNRQLKSLSIANKLY